MNKKFVYQVGNNKKFISRNVSACQYMTYFSNPDITPPSSCV